MRKKGRDIYTPPQETQLIALGCCCGGITHHYSNCNAEVASKARLFSPAAFSAHQSAFVHVTFITSDPFGRILFDCYFAILLCLMEIKYLIDNLN